MLTYKGGNKVGKGTYWDLANGRRIDVALVVPLIEPASPLSKPVSVLPGRS